MKTNQEQQTAFFRGRQDKPAKFEQALVHLRGIWRPRLEAFAYRFGDRVNITRTSGRSRRAAIYYFHTDLAHVQLSLSAMTDQVVERVILNYDL